MPCAAPIAAWQPATGGKLTFGELPRDRGYTPVQVPCGYCILCREEQARQTAVRIYHESQLHDANAFITLTYNDQHLPLKYGTPTLHYADLQKFWKRLRKAVGKVRYVAVGEYGDKHDRPHYHACVFGHAFIHNRTMLRDDLWTNPQLEQAWGLGNVSVGQLNFQTARYTASYITKKLATKQNYVYIDESTGELKPLTQPRAFWSRDPAIGQGWYEKYKQHVNDHDMVIIDGRPQKPPRRYDALLKVENPARYNEIKEERQQNIKGTRKEQEKIARARAQNAHARARNKTKSF